jgi:hypothetical protein
MGWQRVVRNGYLPEREIQTGIGQVQVKAPRIRDRQPDPCSGRIRFTSAILPPYLRKTKSIETLLPWLYLRSFYRRFYRCSGRFIRKRCTGSICCNHQSAQNDLAG